MAQQSRKIQIDYRGSSYDYGSIEPFFNISFL